MSDATKAYKLELSFSAFAGTFADGSDDRTQTILYSRDREKLEAIDREMFGDKSWTYDDDTPYVKACEAYAARRWNDPSPVRTFTLTSDIEVPLVELDNYYGSGRMTDHDIVEFEFLNESIFI